MDLLELDGAVIGGRGKLGALHTKRSKEFFELEMTTHSRRSFLRGSAAGGLGLLLLPARLARGYSANEKVDVAFIGVGGVARGNRARMKRLASDANIVALCDVDEKNLAAALAQHEGAKSHRDYRKMLEEQKGIDAVVVSTPDHSHFPASILAMQLGKGVATEKPMAHTVWEARQLAIAAKKYGVATQMENEHHAKDALRQQVEWVQSGAIGEVREVHIFSNRPIWPQGMKKRPPSEKAPPHTDWDLWIGPAPYRDYHKGLHHFAWRGWWDFGTGALGDMGCHQFDPVFWALELGQPDAVWAEQVGNTDESGPTSAVVTYEFPARVKLPPVTVKWFEGKTKVPRPKALEEGRKLPSGGIVYYGSKETLLAKHPPITEIVPKSRARRFRPPSAFIRRSPGHYKEWLDAIKGGEPASSNFVDYSGPLTELVLLGNLAIRSGEKIEWDAKKLIATSSAKAQQFVRRTYRAGWDFWTA